MIDAAASVRRARAAIGTEYRQSGCLGAVYGWCGSPRTGLPEGSFGSAIIAYRRTIGTIRTDWEQAPAGAIHYWDGDPGHVALGTGNGRAVTTNASQRVSNNRKGVKFALVGERTIPDIGRGRGRYLGWTRDVFNQLINFAGTAGGNITPIEEDDMPDLNELFNTPVMKNAEGTDVSLAQLLSGLDTMAHRIRGDVAGVPGNVWGHPLEHTLAKDGDGKPIQSAAGSLLRYEPAEHQHTRDQLAKLGVTPADFSTAQLAAALAAPEVIAALATALLDSVKARL